MKKLTCIAMVAVLWVCVGCGPVATDTSGSTAPPAEEDIQKELEKAEESGEIDASTYGQDPQ